MVLSRLYHATRRALLAAVALGAVGAGAWAQDRQPLPDAETQARAQELLRDVYGKEYDAAKTSAEKTALARKLLDQAAKSQADPASHFVLLRVAKDVAVLGADAETALEAVERIVTTYDVNAMETRLDCVKGLAAAAKLSSQHGPLAQQAYALVDVALAEDDFQAAGQFGEIARESAQRARDYALRREIIARMEGIDLLQQAHAEYQKAMARLDQSPTDPEANLAAGRYLCLSRGDWERGIPMLALGSDAALKAPAIKELTGADSPDAQVALGDQWWDLAQTKEGGERDCFLLRAGHWYEKAQPKVTSGLVKVKLQQRLDQIGKIEPPAGHVAGTRPGPRGRPSAASGVRPFDPAATVLLATLQGHAGSVRSVSFSPDGKTLVSASVDKTVRFWDVAKRQPSGALPPFKNSELKALLSPDGSSLAVANGDHTISLWNTARGQLRGMLVGHQRPVDCLAFSPDGSMLASGARDNTVLLWDANRGQIRRPLGPLGGRPWSVAFSPDGSLVASGNLDRVVTVWEVATGKLRDTLAGHGGDVRCVAFSPKGDTLASSSRDGTVRLWDARAGTLRRMLEGHVADLWTIAIRADGATLASSGSDGTIGLWDLATGTPHRMLAGHLGAVWSLAFSPDGSLLASAGDDHTVRLWGTDPSGRLPSTVPETTVPPGPVEPMPPSVALADLRVTQVFLENGEKSAWIRNDGDAPAVGVGVQFAVDGQPADTCRVDVPPREQVQATGSKLPPGRRVVSVMVDPDNRIPERNETNNALEAAFTVTLTRDGRTETGQRMSMPKGKVSTPGLTPDDEGWILLPPLVQRDRDTREANWKWDGQAAAFSAERGRAHVSFPVAITGSYELQARVNIPRGTANTEICLPIVAARAAVLQIKGGRDEPTATIRLRSINPEPQPQANASMNIGSEYTFLCRVAVSQAAVGVEVLRDDQILFQWVGPVSQVAEKGMMRPGTVELQTDYYSSAKFTDLRLRMLAGQATALFPEAKTPVGETSTSSRVRPGSEAPAPSTVPTLYNAGWRPWAPTPACPPCFSRFARLES